MTLIDKWKQKYEHQTDDVGLTLTEAKAQGLKYYRHVCSRHGDMLFYTKDNSCPICCAEARQVRNVTNRKYNRCRMVFNEIKRRARLNGVEFNLTLDEFRVVYESVHTCPVFGIEIEPGIGVRSDLSMSVDRLDNSRGYLVDNINIISDRANRIKSDGTALEHLQIAAWMIKQQDRGAYQDLEQIIVRVTNKDKK